MTFLSIKTIYKEIKLGRSKSNHPLSFEVPMVTISHFAEIGQDILTKYDF